MSKTTYVKKYLWISMLFWNQGVSKFFSKVLHIEHNLSEILKDVCILYSIFIALLEWNKIRKQKGLKNERSIHVFKIYTILLS